jgi:hypothetical protein
MKTYVLLLLWLLAGIASHAQPNLPLHREAFADCRNCCDSPDEPGLLRVLAPELSLQCPQCTLLSVAVCRLTEADIEAASPVVRYTLRMPDGKVSAHMTTMTLTAQGWMTPLYPPGSTALPCAPPAL